MLVKELIYNNEFDCNCNYEIYDCTEKGKQYGDGAEIIFSTTWGDCEKLSDDILNMQIKYITTRDRCIIIEAAKQKDIFTNILLYFAVDEYQNYLYITEKEMHGSKNKNRLVSIIHDKNALNKEINWNKLDNEHKPKDMGLYQSVIECRQTNCDLELNAVTCTPVCFI